MSALAKRQEYMKTIATKAKGGAFGSQGNSNSSKLKDSQGHAIEQISQEKIVDLDSKSNRNLRLSEALNKIKADAAKAGPREKPNYSSSILQPSQPVEERIVTGQAMSGRKSIVAPQTSRIDTGRGGSRIGLGSFLSASKDGASAGKSSPVKST